MTTIVYNKEENEIAVDSRMMMGNFIESDDYIKMISVGNRKFFLAGELADIQMIARCYPNNLEYEINQSSHGFVVENGIIKYIYTNGLKIKETHQTNSSAVGSGFEFAIAALDMGKTTYEAVKYAATRDSYTGGKIRIYNIKDL